MLLHELASFVHERRIKMPLTPIGACVHAKKRRQQIRKVPSSPPIPVTGISVLQDTVEGLSIHLPKSSLLANSVQASRLTAVLLVQLRMEGRN